MRELYRRCLQRAFGRRAGVVLILVLTVTLVVAMAPPDDAALSASGPSLGAFLSWLESGLTTPVGFASPRKPPTGPRQASGTAAERGHRATSASTRAGRGTGRKPGTGKGELAAASPTVRPAKAGLSAGPRGFVAARSKMVDAKSTATTTYYTNPDGSFSRQYSAGPVNFKDGKNGWKRINTAVRKAADGRWQETANSAEVQFADYADDPKLVSVAPDSTHAVAERLVGAMHVAGTGQLSTVTYVEALPHTDVQVEAIPAGEKESLILHDAQAAAEWDFNLDLDGLSAFPLPSGAIELRTAAGKTLATLPAGSAHDSAVTKDGPATTTAVTYTLAGETLHVALDGAWLHAAARVFPVTVDPTISFRPLTTYVEQGSSVADRSNDQVVKVGTPDNGTHVDRAFLDFSDDGVAKSNVPISAATLTLFAYYASSCTPTRVDVAPVTEAWTPSGTTAWPGPAISPTSIGNATPNLSTACKQVYNQTVNGDSFGIPLATGPINDWAKGIIPDYGLAVYTTATNVSNQKYLAGDLSSDHVPNLTLTYTGYVLPTILTQSPANGAATGTVTPTLSAMGDKDPGLATNLSFYYQVYDPSGVKVADSGKTTVASSWTVPQGKLQWGRTYSWTVQSYDGTNFSADPPWYQFTTQVPQPAVTSSLSQNQTHGFDASIGNYTTSSTDADVSTIGPPLSITRSYNSRDPRGTAAFGAAWAATPDSHITEQYTRTGAVFDVIVTYPDGSNVAYGRNADGSFTTPAGRAATLIQLASGYELIDKSVTTFVFGQAVAPGIYGLTSIVDAAQRAETLSWSGGHVITMTSAASGRALHLGWSTPAGATAAHVATVSTDPLTPGQADSAYVWTYNYAADQLTSVCPPGTTTDCTRYAYDPHAAAQTRNEVLDLGATSYWPLGEKTGAQAESAILANEGTDDARYVGSVGLGGTATPLASSSATGITLNGTTAQVTLPDLKMSSSIAQSFSMWFKAAAGTPAGVLYGMADMPIAGTSSSGNSQPVLYLGTSGKLYGEFWQTAEDDVPPNPLHTTATVADGKWHNVVLTGAQDKQYLYVDGTQYGPIDGWGKHGRDLIDPTADHYNYLGAGYLGPSPNETGPWPDQPHGGTDGAVYGSYFKGSLSDAAFYGSRVLGKSDAQALYDAGLHAGTLMTSATRPSGKTYASVAYDPVSTRVTSVTDENGGVWGLAAPTASGSSQVYRAAVLGSGPLAYYRLGETVGAQYAPSEVHWAPATYAGTKLGDPGPFNDEPAATFSGSQSSVQIPKEAIPPGSSSQELWFRTDPTVSGEILLSSQSSALGATTCPCRPILWITGDGLLRGLSASPTPTGPLAAKSIAGKCIDLWGGSTVDHTKVDVHDCNSTSAQSVTFAADGSVQFMGHCLDLAGGASANGTKLEIDSCVSGKASQQWSKTANGLKNVAAGRCLDDPSRSTVNGTQVQVWDCSAGAASQAWIQSLASQRKVTDGGWHQALLSNNDGTQSLYVDGVKASSSQGDSGATAAGLPYTYLGGGYTGSEDISSSLAGLTYAGTPMFTGSLGEAAFYGAGLSEADAAAHYAAARNSAGTTPVLSVQVTDPGGKQLTNQYDLLNGNRQIASIDGLGNKTTFGYDVGGFMHTTTDPNGNVITTGHDAAGNVVSTTTCQDRVAGKCATGYATFQPTSMGLDAATGAVVTASSASTATDLSPTALVDGNIASVVGALGFATAPQTAAANTQWVQADLRTAKTIDQVVLYPRTDVTGGFPLTFTLQVSADGSSWTTETTQTNYAVPAPGKQATFSFAPISARYIKLNATALRASSTTGKFDIELGELAALNDRPDPLAGVQLTQRDPRSASSTDNTYLTTYKYDSLGNPKSVTSPPVTGSPSGRTTTVDYTDGTSVAAADTGFAPAGLPYRTTSPGGAVYLVSYFHNGDVAGTTDPDGLVSRFTYDSLGRVRTKTVVSDTYAAGLTTTYSYDGQGQLLTQDDPPIADRVSAVVHTGRTTTTYDPDGDVLSTTVTDQTGGDPPRVTSDTYNAYDQVDSATDAEGNVTRSEYDTYGNRSAELDSLGNRIEYTFDPNGKPLSQVLTNYVGDPVHPQPATRLTEVSRAYDPAGRLASITDAMGDTTSYTYTDDNRPATATRTDFAGKNPYVLKSDFYDPAGNLSREVTNNGATTTVVTVDAASRPTATTVDPGGVNRTTTVTYTPDDGIATNVASSGTGASVTTSATYDAMGHLKSKSVHTDTPGYTDDLSTSWTLDKRGLPVSQTDGNGHVTDVVYDEAGRLAVTTAPSADLESGGAPAVTGRPVTKTGYDTFGDAVESQNPDGGIARTGYDRNSRVTSVTMPDYFPPGGMLPLVSTVTRKYDAVGNVAFSYDALNNETAYVYDQLGDLAKTTTPDGGVTQTTYDPNGEPNDAVDPNGGERQATYDHLGRLKTSTVIDRYPAAAAYTTNYHYDASTTDPGGAWASTVVSPTGVTLTTGYDHVGETVSSTDGAGNTTAYTYDVLGRRSRTTLPDGTATTSGYDQAGNQVSATALDSDGSVLATQSKVFDSNGNPIKWTDGRGHTTTFGYDADNVLTSEVQPVDDGHSITTTFGHDAAGNRTRYSDGRQNAWTYTWNSWQLPESTIEPATASYASPEDRTTTTTYDLRGLASAQSLPGGVAVTQQYDVMGNLHTASGTGADAVTAARTFGYDKNQRLTSAATDPAGGAAGSAETFSYDDRGDLLAATGSAGNSAFTWNGDGAMTSRTDAAGITGYGYDTAGRLHTVDDAATGDKLTLSYTNLSQIHDITYGDGGDVRTFDYDHQHRLTGDRLADKTGQTVAVIGYGYDQNGNVSSKTTSGFGGSPQSNKYTYDYANRLTSWDNGSSSTVYGYDDSGNRNRIGANVYTYDARDQLTSDGHNSYSYTARGTLSARNTTTSTSDAFGQAVTQGGQQYAYDALGRNVSAGSTRFAFSGAGNAMASDGAHTYSRAPGDTLIGIGTVGGTSADARLAFTDQHTDVVGNFTAGGTALTGSTTYDPLGAVLSSAGMVGGLRYQSGWTDPASGNVNMASRWYSPSTGQFSTKDSEAQSPVPDSAAANPFAYVSDNPLTGTDPSGHGWLSSAWHAVKSGASRAWTATRNFAVNTWNSVSSAVSTAWNYVSNKWDSLVSAVSRKLRQFENWVDDQFRAAEREYQQWKAAAEAKLRAANAKLKREAREQAEVIRKLNAEVAKLDQAGFKYVKNHAASIATFVVSTGVFIGCEAVLGAATGGVGAVAGAAACGALSGAVGGLVNQGFKCAQGGKADCSAGAFLKAGLVGGVIGAVAGVGGALGGKLLSAVGGKALQAIGGLFGRVGGAEAEGGATSAVESGATSASEGATSTSADSAATSAADGSATSGSDRAAAAGAQEAGGSGGAREESGSSEGCASGVPHSFAGSVRVLLANGDDKPIDQVRPGDRVLSSVPGTDDAETHTVEKVIVTTTDRDFVDLTIAPIRPRKGVKKAVAAAMAVVTAAATLTTTFHHPFYDETKAAFVAAADVTAGDVLQTPTGEAVVRAQRRYHAVGITYDLTVNGLHTYYVMAGTTPILVHNCGLIDAVHAEYGRITTPGSSDYLSISKRGPVLTGVKDEATGDIVTSLNHGTAIDNLHPSLAARSGPDVGLLYPGGSGIHGEVHGLNELLWRRESAGLSTQIDDSFSFYSVRLRGAQQGMPIPPCSLCSRLTP